MIGANLKKLRLKYGLTQKNLADKLFVSAQAVSRWENGEVEPSIGTIMEMAKIFNVSVDEILGMNDSTQEHKKNNNEKDVAEKERIVYVQQPTRQFLAVCEQCNNPIYESKQIIRKGGKVICSKCNAENEEQSKREAHENFLKNVAKGEKRRKLSFIFGGITGGVFLLLDIICWMSFPNPLFILISLYPVVAMYTFVSCCILNNNFVGELFLEILTWNIKLPGLIFTWDIDGCMWFIAMKILFIVYTV